MTQRNNSDFKLVKEGRINWHHLKLKRYAIRLLKKVCSLTIKIHALPDKISVLLCTFVVVLVLPPKHCVKLGTQYLTVITTNCQLNQMTDFWPDSFEVGNCNKIIV